MAFVLARCDGVDADGADDGGVAQGGLRGDDRVGDVVVDGLVIVSVSSGSMTIAQHSVFPTNIIRPSSSLQGIRNET